MTLRQWALSAMIVLHLIVIVIAPNPGLEGAAAWLEPYTKTLGMDSRWQFFSPDPARPEFYEYDAVDTAARSTVHTFPELSSPFWFRSTYDRRIALMRAASESVEVFKRSFVPMLCREHTGAVFLRVRSVSLAFPTVNEVKQGQRLNDLRESRRQEIRHKGVFVCKR